MSVIDTHRDADDTSPDVNDETAAAETAAAESSPAKTAGAEQHSTERERTPRQISVSLRGVVIGAVIALLAGAVGVLGWLYVDAKGQLDANALQVSNTERAQVLALEYAVNAAEMNYQDFAGWKVRLVAGTSPELKDKLANAADSMEQVLAPLQWQSSARPLAATVRSHTGGIYTVDAFVSVLTKTMQAPEGLQSTATYSITVDSRNDWQITDVGGVDAALGR